MIIVKLGKEHTIFSLCFFVPVMAWKFNGTGKSDVNTAGYEQVILQFYNYEKRNLQICFHKFYWQLLLPVWL